MNEPDDFSALFAPEPAAPAEELHAAPWKVLLVDDEPDIHAVLHLAAQDIVVEGRGLLLLDAQSGAEARARLAEHPDIALILLDVVMESEGAGLELVRHIRNELGNRTVQIVLVTGQPGHAPQREVIAEYRIDGYRLKSELTTEKIFVSVFAALRTHQALIELAATSRELKIHRDHLEALVAERTTALQASNQQLADTQFAMDRAGIGIHWVAADSGRFLYVNNHAAKLLGYSVDEMLQLGVPDIAPYFAGKNFGEATRELAASGTATFESIEKHRDGREIPVEVTLYYQPAKELLAGRFISFITEISQRKEAELALRSAKEAAESANQAKSAFLARMSHEILTPINGILGMTHLLAHSGLSDKQAAQFDKVRRAGLRLLHIVNNLLDLSNMEAGKLAIEARNFSVNDLRLSITDILSEWAAVQPLAVEIDFSALPAQLLGDDNRLRQILLNYLDNALKFTERGSVTLNACIEAETEGDLSIRFEVRDTGIGIPVEQQANLFCRFEQVDKSSSRKYGGSGIGLAINKRLAELMGGAVGVSSQPNQGSTFWLSVRMGRVKNALTTGLTAESMDAEEILRRRYRGLRLLLAEDDPTNQAVTIGLLQDVGLLIDPAVDGGQAVDMSARGNYALILMDMQMPGMDGVEATRRIRARPDGKNIPIIAMTANAYADDRTCCFEVGMNDFIAKPINPEVVFATLLKWLPVPMAMAPAPVPESAVAPPEVPAAAQADPNAGLINRLSAVPGLDVARGISVVRGKTAKYIELLARFVESHADDMDRLAESIAAGDHATAVLLAHRLKGAAATLGIVSLAEAARHIEQQEREQKGDSLELQADMNTVRHELEVIGAVLPADHAVTSVQAEARPVDPQVSEKLLNELDERLANDDFTAIAFFQEHSQTLLGRLGNQYDAVARQIGQFEFATVREILGGLRSKR